MTELIGDVGGDREFGAGDRNGVVTDTFGTRTVFAVRKELARRRRHRTVRQTDIIAQIDFARFASKARTPDVTISIIELDVRFELPNGRRISGFAREARGRNPISREPDVRVAGSLTPAILVFAGESNDIVAVVNVRMNRFIAMPNFQLIIQVALLVKVLRGPRNVLGFRDDHKGSHDGHRE